MGVHFPSAATGEATRGMSGLLPSLARAIRVVPAAPGHTRGSLLCGLDDASTATVALDHEVRGANPAHATALPTALPSIRTAVPSSLTAPHGPSQQAEATAAEAAGGGGGEATTQVARGGWAAPTTRMSPVAFRERATKSYEAPAAKWCVGAGESGARRCGQRRRGSSQVAGR
jgi:hypothetical protein